MPQYSFILSSTEPTKFVEILAASSRKAREGYFHRHHIRAPKTSGMPKAGAKHEHCARALHTHLQGHADDPLAEEALRTWLMGRRPLLAAALDHLKIPHQEGLTDSDDVARIEKLGGAELAALVAKLRTVAPVADVRIYLLFMGAEGVDEAVAA